MKCPNCNAEIKEGSIICPICNTQFAFTANDNYINLPDDDLIVKPKEVEEYFNPNEGSSSVVNQPVGTLNLKTNNTPKKVIKRVVKVNTIPQEESVEISPSVTFDKNDEVVEDVVQQPETTVVNVGGFTNTIIDTTTAQIPTVQEQETVTSVAPPVMNNDLSMPLSGTNNISIINSNTDTIGVVNSMEVEEDEKKPKKISETMMITIIMILMMILIGFIIYILLQNNKKNEIQGNTTTVMTQFNCDDGRCDTTETTTTETTTTKPKITNNGLKSTLEFPLEIGKTSLCQIFDNKDNKEVMVDVTLDKIYSPEEAQDYMKNYDNSNYEVGLSVGVLQYTITGNELEDGKELNALTNVSFYPLQYSNKFAFNGAAYNVGFVGDVKETLTNQKSVTVTGYYNYPSDQQIGYICIGDYDGEKACFKIN